MAGGGGNGQCALTKTQSAQLRGGGGRGGQGGAMDELAVTFLRWRASLEMAWLARQWRRGRALLLRAVEAKEVKNGLTSWSGRRVGGSSHGRQCQDGRGAWLRGQAAGDGCHPRGARFLNLVDTVARLKL